jgi:DNA-binding FadR family transcriptional regulator
VREALRLLASEHLVVTVRGVAGGSFVAHPSPAQLGESLCTGIRLWQANSLVNAESLLEVREMVEVPATALAAQRRTDRQLEAIAATLFDPWTAGTVEMLAAHRAFHAAIAAASGNALLELVTLPLHAVTDDLRMVEDLGREFWVRVDAEHRQILAAVTAGEVEQARTAAEAHLNQVRRTLRVAPAGPVDVQTTPAPSVAESVL